jgi:hypothetical protein
MVTVRTPSPRSTSAGLLTLVTEDAERHARTGDDGELDGSGETLVTLGIVVLEADLESIFLLTESATVRLVDDLLDGLQEVALLGLIGVLEELLDVLANGGDRDFRHFDSTSPK